jgi:predicted amidohydrolase
MEVREVREELAPFGLEPPDLEMLRPTEASYTCLLLQPSGPIFADRNRIGGLDQELNRRKVLAFAGLAKRKGAHLAVAPEYFTPWSAVKSLIEQGVVPPPGALWVLGCESITQPELAKFQDGVAGACDVVHERCDALAADRPMLDPVVLLFTTKHTGGSSRLVALVQFKTHPSRDRLFFEEGLLKRGTRIYRFRGRCATLSTVVLVCSDAFAVDDACVGGLVDRSTLIHIQLNPDPRNSVYRQYRKTAFERDPRMSECHILCLNWARTVAQHDDEGKTETWPAVGCSTWYCPEDACAHADEIVLPNHWLGLYYTHMKERRHALLFDYDEAVFECRVPKVVTTGQAVLANKNGPNSLGRYEWENDSSAWVVQSDLRKAGFDQLLRTNAEASTALAHVDLQNALNVERLLALSAGTIVGTDDWYSLENIDSFCIEPDEVVRRITVAQDPSDGAVRFRHARLEVMANIRHELDTRPTWPPQIAGTDRNAQIGWDARTGHFNIHCADGRPGLVCYLGDAPSRLELENIPSMLIDLLRQAGGPHQTRLCVLYRRFGELKFAPLPGMTRFDDALMDERDILSADPNRSTEEV